MGSCSWKELSCGIEADRDMITANDQTSSRNPPCKSFCGLFLPHQLDSSLLLTLFVGSIFWHLIQVLATKRKLDKLRNHVQENLLNVDTLYGAISDTLPKLDATLKELGEKFSGLQSNYSKENSRLKLNFPRFSGIQEPEEWIDRVCQFFKYNSTIEDQRVSLASYYLEGEAFQWLEWLKRSYNQDESEITWETFKKELASRFGPAEEEDCGEALRNVKQTGSLKAYRKEFERLSNRVKDLAQKELIGTFMAGLKEEITGDMSFSRPKTLYETVEMARNADEKLTRQWNSSHSGYSSSSS